MRPSILVVDDEESIRFTFETFLENAGFQVYTATSFAEGMQCVEERSYDIIFADIILGDHSGVELLREIKQRRLQAPVILVTGEPNMDTATEALRLGAYDYIPKPVNKSTLLTVARRALAYKELAEANERYRTNLEAVFQSVSEGIVIVDNDLTLLDINEAARRICGTTRDKIGMDYRQIAINCGGVCASRLAEAVASRETLEVYRTECRRDGNRVVTLTASPLQSTEGSYLGAVLTIKDETRLDLFERENRDRRRFHALVGQSRSMQEIYGLIDSLASLPTTVLIVGESGTGKELVADALHHRGARKDRSLVKVNCSALSETLLESELFGHVKGSFTGAVNDRVGRLEQAHRGTIFLDEIGDISPGVQVKLLRVLQEMQFERVGANTPIAVDVRVVAATNADLRKRVAEGKFREDLYFRLKVMELRIPPLRERREDIPMLVDHFLEKIRKRLGRPVSAVSQEVMERFMGYDWPGNVRELEHTLEHAAVMSRSTTITVRDLPPEFAKVAPERRHVPVGSAFSLKESAADERSRLLATLCKAGWNKSKAARMLGISVRTLYRKIDKHEMHEDECFES